MPNRNIPRKEGRKTYLSIEKHQPNSKNSHAKWVSQDREIEVFDAADYGAFLKEEGHESWEVDGNLWGFMKEQGDVLTVGTESQQFGFFPKPQNETDDWHGYPIMPNAKGNQIKKYNIDKSLLERWVQDGHLTQQQVTIIIRGKLL